MTLLISKYKETVNLSAIPMPEEVVTASSEYLEDNNPVGRWLGDNFIITHDNKDMIKSSDLYTEFLRSADDKMTMTAFGIAMNQINNIPRKQKKTNGINGLD